VCFQFPEETSGTSVARQAGYENLADVGRARVLAAIDKVGGPAGVVVGLRAFELADTHFRQWQEPVDRSREALLQQLTLSIDPLLPGATPERIAYEIALKEGYGLDLRIERAGSPEDQLLSVTDASRARRFWLCLADRVDAARLEQVGIAADDLLVCRDAALDDSTAANLELRCRLKTL
jgi:adenine-specific DNA-methyltransferase